MFSINSVSVGSMDFCRLKIKVVEISKFILDINKQTTKEQQAVTQSADPTNVILGFNKYKQYFFFKWSLFPFRDTIAASTDRLETKIN